MNSRERVIRAIQHRPVDRLPREPWALPGVSMFRKKEYEILLSKYPSDFTGPGVSYNPGEREQGTPCVGGKYMDAWGCLWEVKEDGVIGEVKHALFENDYEGLEEYEAPWELLEGLDPEEIARNCAATDKFVLANTEARPFERMQFLRGTEDLLCDLARDDPRAYVLRDKLHEFYLAEMRFWASTAVDGVSFMDDWGTQRALLINPEKWRSFFKPLYREYCEILHAAGKYVFFHSDGNIEAIYPDLIEIGVDCINSQLFCMDMEKLGREYAGKITFWGEIDRQHLLPFGTKEEVAAGVRRAYKALCPDGKLTGCIAQCEWGVKDPVENIHAVYREWDLIAKEQRIEKLNIDFGLLTTCLFWHAHPVYVAPDEGRTYNAYLHAGKIKALENKIRLPHFSKAPIYQRYLELAQEVEGVDFSDFLSRFPHFDFVPDDDDYRIFGKMGIIWSTPLNRSISQIFIAIRRTLRAPSPSNGASGKAISKNKRLSNPNGLLKMFI